MAIGDQSFNFEAFTRKANPGVAAPAPAPAPAPKIEQPAALAGTGEIPHETVASAVSMAASEIAVEHAKNGVDLSVPENNTMFLATVASASSLVSSEAWRGAMNDLKTAAQNGDKAAIAAAEKNLDAVIDEKVVITGNGMGFNLTPPVADVKQMALSSQEKLDAGMDKLSAGSARKVADVHTSGLTRTSLFNNAALAADLRGHFDRGEEVPASLNGSEPELAKKQAAEGKVSPYDKYGNLERDDWSGIINKKAGVEAEKAVEDRANGPQANVQQQPVEMTKLAMNQSMSDKGHSGGIGA